MAGRSKISVLIVDDHPLFREGLRQVIASDDRFQLVGEANDAETALKLIQQTKPSVIVLDVNLPGMSGLELASVLRTKKYKAGLVVLTTFKEDQVFNKAMNLGVQGFILKENIASEILNCIATVAQGEHYVSPSLSGLLLRRKNRTEALASRTPSLADLTKAERRILKAIAQNKSSKQIASELFVSYRTIESHRANIAGKLSIKGANSLLQFALEHRDELDHLV